MSTDWIHTKPLTEQEFADLAQLFTPTEISLFAERVVAVLTESVIRGHDCACQDVLDLIKEAERYITSLSH